MGYNTNFQGVIKLDKPLTVAQRSYLQKFAQVRHVKRDEKLVANQKDPSREVVGLPIGPEGCYFTAGDIYGEDESVLDTNIPPTSQPGLYCQWVPTEDGQEIEWDGGEKFYEYIDWMRYILSNFILPWGLIANGEITWEGEDSNDLGKIVVKDNILTIKRGKRGKVTYK